jgi:adhesin HecA-like repeat protein
MRYRMQFAMLAVTICLLGAAAGAQTILSIDPSSHTVAAGTDFTVDVNISGVSSLYGYQFDLSFNPSVLSAVSSSEGSFLSKGGSTYFVPGTNDNTHGVVSATADTLLSNSKGASGSGNLVVFTFDAIKSGFSTLTISGTQLINSSFGSISASTSGGSISVTGIKAPEIDPSSALGAITLLAGCLLLLRERSAPRRALENQSTEGVNQP